MSMLQEAPTAPPSKRHARAAPGNPRPAAGSVSHSPCLVLVTQLLRDDGGGYEQ